MSDRLRFAVAGTLVTVLIAVLALIVVPWTETLTQVDPVRLPRQVGLAHEATLASEDTHQYVLILEAGEFVHLVVEQRGVDAVVEAYGPGNENLLKVDTPVLDQGAEHIYLVAGTTGENRILLKPWSGSGRYIVRLEALRSATDRDVEYALAAHIFSDAEQLRRDNALSEARKAYQQSLVAWRRVGDSYQEALTLRRLGGVLNHLGAAHEALESNQRALTIFTRLGNKQQMAVLFNNVGRGLRLIGRTQDAAESYTSALSIAREIDFYQAEDVALHNLGMLAYFQGDYLTALHRFEEAIVVLNKAGDRTEVADTLECIGATYCLAGKLDEALDYLFQALRLRKADDHEGQADTLTQIGWVYHLKREWGKAVEYHTQALDHRRAAKDKFGEATVLGRLASSYRELGREEEALRSYLDSLLFFSGVYHLEEAHTLVNLADLQIRRGYPHLSVKYCQEATALFQQVGDLNGEASSRLTHAQAERARGNLEAAYEQLTLAVGIIDELRVQPNRQSLKTSFFAARHSYYELYIDLLMEMHAAAPDCGLSSLAFDAFERSRARTMLDSLHNQQTDREMDLDGQLRSQKEAVQKALALQARERERLMISKASQEEIDAVDQKLRELDIEYERVEDRIFSADPEYINSLSDAKPLQMKDVQSLLDADTILLAYALGDRGSYLWLVEKGSYSVYSLPPRSKIEELAECTFAAVSNSRSTAFRGQAKMLAQQLSVMLLDQVSSKLEHKRLLIVTDGLLALAPFAALPDPVELGLGYSREKKFLIEKHEIINIPSLSILNELRLRQRRRQPRQKELAIFADPVFSARDSRVQRPSEQDTESVSETEDTSGTRLLRLPFSAKEALEIGGFVPEHQRLEALGFDASRDRVLHTDLSQYRILHFSTHGLLHSDFPRLSGLTMSMVDEHGKYKHGYLFDYEISELHLPVDLVVLSACKTGQGKPVRGEGVLNLSRSFMEAGAVRVIVSQWNVNDQAAAELMERFYKELLMENRSPGEALRTAQIAMMREQIWESPFYWAGFILQGDWEEMPTRRSVDLNNLHLTVSE